MCYSKTWKSLRCISRHSAKKAYKKALKCDLVSAFGGVVAFNKTVNEQTAMKF